MPSKRGSAHPAATGDVLTVELTVKRLGRTSLTLQQIATCGTDLRFETELTLVHVDENGAATPWPEKVARVLKGAQNGDLI